MKLDEYRKKRHFGATPEPPGALGAPRSGIVGSFTLCTRIRHRTCAMIFVWSGAAYCFPGLCERTFARSSGEASRDADGRPPIRIANFEGVIPADQYGAGTVMLWDTGTWRPDDADVDSSLQEGEIKFELQGEKLRGSWVLVRTPGFGKNPTQSTWLLIKHRDQYASTKDVTQEEPRSVASQRLLAETAPDGKGDVDGPSRGHPAGKVRRAAMAKSGTKRKVPS